MSDGRSAAVHTSRNKGSRWEVVLTESGPELLIIFPDGRRYEALLMGDNAERMAAALHNAAREHMRRVTMKIGEHVGRM